MVYLKSALVGILTAVVAVAILVAVLLRISYSEGSGALFINIAEWQILAAALAGFGAGFWWRLRRLRLTQRLP
jgi:preprotein translocase subunit SecG